MQNRLKEKFFFYEKLTDNTRNASSGTSHHHHVAKSEFKDLHESAKKGDIWPAEKAANFFLRGLLQHYIATEAFVLFNYNEPGYAEYQLIIDHYSLHSMSHLLAKDESMDVLTIPIKQCFERVKQAAHIASWGALFNQLKQQCEHLYGLLERQELTPAQSEAAQKDLLKLDEYNEEVQEAVYNIIRFYYIQIYNSIHHHPSPQQEKSHSRTDYEEKLAAFDPMKAIVIGGYFKKTFDQINQYNHNFHQNYLGKNYFLNETGAGIEHLWYNALNPTIVFTPIHAHIERLSKPSSGFFSSITRNKPLELAKIAYMEAVQETLDVGSHLNIDDTRSIWRNVQESDARFTRFTYEKVHQGKTKKSVLEALHCCEPREDEGPTKCQINT